MTTKQLKTIYFHAKYLLIVLYAIATNCLRIPKELGLLQIIHKVTIALNLMATGVIFRAEEFVVLKQLIRTLTKTTVDAMKKI